MAVRCPISRSLIARRRSARRQSEAAIIRIAIKTTPGERLTDEQRQLNWCHAHVRSQAERANSLLKTTFQALRRVSLDPSAIGRITAAALVVLHVEHDRTT